MKSRTRPSTKIGLLAGLAVLTVVLLADCDGGSSTNNAQNPPSITSLDTTDTSTDMTTDPATDTTTDSAIDTATPTITAPPSTTAQPSKTAPRSSFSPPPGSLAACALPYLQVSVKHASGGDSHQGVILLFRNTGQIACAMTGYPGAALLNAQGKQVKQAARTPVGYLGGLRSGKPTTVPLYSGQTASALLEGEVVDINGKTCASSPAILVTPPNTTTSAKLKVTTQMCGGTQIHPVVTGTSGSST